jgi:hypothetical protein
MIKNALAIAGVVLAVAACGSGPAGQASNPTAASVAVQPGDVPKGMVRCDLSGDIDTFLGKEKTADPNTYSSISTEWADAKKLGATAAAIAFYSDSAAHCTAIKTSGADISSASYKLVVNFVVQFKSAATAATAYKSESVFGFSTDELRKTASATGGTGQVTEGVKTGLTANSLTLYAPVAGQSYYIADWQNKSFMVILAVLNVDQSASKKIATSENSRIT